MNQIKILTISALGFLIISCNKVAEVPLGSNKIEITGTSVDTVKGTWAVITSLAKRGDQGIIIDHGFCWGTNPLPDLSGLHTSLGSLQNSKQFSMKLTGLLPSTKYCTRAYVKNNYTLIYGTQSEFSTFALTSPQVITNDVTDITSTSVQCGGNVTSDGNGTVLMRGVCWKKTANPKLYDCIDRTMNGTSVGSFTSQVTGLTKGTIYYMTSYVMNEKDTGYGEVKTFTTPTVDRPTVITLAVIPIDSSAQGGGNVTTDGGSPVTTRGVCWSLNSNPTINNIHSSDGSGTGTFASNIINLVPNTLYYVRSYATNSAGTSYGNEVVFTTLPPQKYHIGQSFGGGIIFYIDTTGQHGLIAAISDQSTATQWGCIYTEIGVTLTVIGSGEANTTSIINGCGSSDIAARICYNLVLNGYNDWFLPSKDELELLYNLKEVIGGFTSNFYLSSSEASASLAWGKHFGNGYMNIDYKDVNNYVRAIRKF